MARALGVVAIAFFVGQVTENRVILAIAFSIHLVPLAPLGRTTLRQSDDEWAGNPMPPAVRIGS